MKILEMKKIVFYPILFALNPILLLFSANISLLSLSDLFPAILISPLVCGAIYFAISKLLNNTHRAGYITFLMIIWFFHYGTLSFTNRLLQRGSINIDSFWLVLPLWSLFFIFLGSNFIWNRITKPQIITTYLNILVVILISFSVCRISIDIVPRYALQPLSDELGEFDLSKLDESSKPDIYYIILDGYARQDVLLDIFSFDNQEFVQSLKRLGFQIPASSQSNYMQTALSLASSLNFQYLTDISPIMQERGLLIGKIHHSQTRTFLNNLGYQFITFPSGYQPSEITDSSLFLQSSSLSRGYDFEVIILVNTALSPLIKLELLDMPYSQFSRHQERVLYTFQTLPTLTKASDPIFVFAHIVIPHPPLIFDANGPITPDAFYYLSDEGYKSFLGYTNQVQYTNKLVLETVRQILENSTEPPIIILQADHGSGAYLSYSSVSDTCLYERFSILTAIYLPSSGGLQVPNDISPVNIFRLIFNEYFKTNLEMLPNQYYYSSWKHPYQFVDVTGLTEIPCPIP